MSTFLKALDAQFRQSATWQFSRPPSWAHLVKLDGGASPTRTTIINREDRLRRYREREEVPRLAYTVQETSQAIGCDARVVVAMIEDGSLTAVNLRPNSSRGSWRIGLEAIHALLGNGGGGGN